MTEKEKEEYTIYSLGYDKNVLRDFLKDERKEEYPGFPEGFDLGVSSGPSPITNQISNIYEGDTITKIYASDIVNDGHWLPSKTSVYDLGSSPFKWRNLILSGGIRMPGATTESNVIISSGALDAIGISNNDGPNMFVMTNTFADFRERELKENAKRVAKIHIGATAPPEEDESWLWIDTS